jgi:hypothetical protein
LRSSRSGQRENASEQRELAAAVELPPLKPKPSLSGPPADATFARSAQTPAEFFIGKHLEPA